MSKRFTKIICSVVAAVSALSFAALPACNANWSALSEKDTSAGTVTSNGGFVVETGDYAYFINGKASNTDANNFGSVVKGSVQRIKKSDIAAHNYANTQTVVPSVVYSGSYDAGLCIYGDYIYYTSPSTAKNLDGDVLNSNLDFKRTKLDGSDTSLLWQTENNGVDYRYVEVDGTVYILYYLEEKLYGDTQAKNIHSVNCTTGADTVIAYNVDSYKFDTENPENPYAYYVMSVYDDISDANSKTKYNQIYRVRADAAESPREYDFSGISDYDAGKDPVYINYGYHVFDGVGYIDMQDVETGAKNKLNQFNYGYGESGTAEISNAGYSFGLQWYKNGVLYYTRQNLLTSSTHLFTVTDKQLGDTSKEVTGWNAISKNAEQPKFIEGGDTTAYTFVTIGGKLYAISGASNGITRQEVSDGKLGEKLLLDDNAKSANVLFVRENENGHTNVYYSVSGGNGYTINRLSVDGSYEDYARLPENEDAKLEYSSIKVLDLDACSGWYKPEFVGNTLLFASETRGMTSYNYIMACDLSGANGVMTNAELKSFNEKYTGVTDKIKKYDEETNSDDSKAYENLADALTYLYYTQDAEYLGELRQAFVDVENKGEYAYYSKESVEKFNDFKDAKGDWADYAAEERNGVTSNFRDYYYGLIGKMSEEDAKGLKEVYKNDYMLTYPVDNSTWWEKLSVGGKVGFIIGMVAAGLLVLGGIAVAIVFIVKRKKKAAEEEAEGSSKKRKVDITDDKSVNVYGDEEND